MRRPNIQLPAFVNKVNPKVVGFIGAVLILLYTGYGIYLIVHGQQEVKLRNLQIKTMITDREELKLHIQELRLDYDKAKSDANTSKEQLQEKEEVIKQQEQQLKEKDAALQAKAEQKRQHEQALARAAQLSSATAHAASSGDHEAITWNFLQNQGFTRNQTAGIMGNLMQEHRFKTDDVPGGLGIAQWLGGRRANLMARANYLSIHVQLQFMVDEMNGPEKAAGDAVRASGSVEAATIAFQNKFERCGMCHQGQRIQYAYEILGRH